MSGNHLPALSKIRIDWFHYRSFVWRLGQVIANVRACSVDMVGLACDGDPGYLKFVREITDSLGSLNAL